MSVCACLARDTDDHLCHRTKPSHFCPCHHVLCATRRATYVTPSPHRLCVLCALSCIQRLAKCSDQFPSLNLVYPPCLPVQDASNGLRHDFKGANTTLLAQRAARGNRPFTFPFACGNTVQRLQRPPQPQPGGDLAIMAKNIFSNDVSASLGDAYPLLISLLICSSWLS